MAAVSAPSTFGRAPTGFGDPHSNDLHRPATSPDVLVLCGYEPGTDEVGKQCARDSVRKQQRFGEAALVDGEQLQDIARFVGEMTVLRGRRYAEPLASRPVTSPV